MAGLETGFEGDEGALMDDMLLSYIAAKDVPPEQAAAQFRKILDKVHAAMLKSKTAPTAKKGKPKLPPTAPGRRPAKDTEYRPSWEALRTAGYRNFIEWRSDGAKRLSEPR